MPPAYLVQFSSDKAHERAIAALLTVPETRHGFPDRRMLITARHLEALDQQKIPYTILSNGPNGAAVAGKSDKAS